jgi:hypothetical protein
VVEQNRFGTVVPGPDEEPASSAAQPPNVQPSSPQPGYAYAAPSSPSPSPPSSYPPPSYPPPSYPPPTPSAYPTYPPPGYGSTLPQYAGPPARRSMRTGWIVGIGAAVLVGVAILVAIAVPVVQEQQAKAAAARTTFAIPIAIAGMNRMTGAADAAVQGQVATLPSGIGTPLGAAYGSGGTVSIIVLGGVHAMTGKGQSDFFVGFQRSLQAQGVQLARVSPGVLGGRMECGSSADGRRTICGFTDSGALGAVVVVGSGDAAHQLALVVRSAVERRS